MKTNFYKGLAGALLCLSAVFASCNTEQPEVLNKLSVTPDTDIAFLAADNGNVVLSVATDAAEWNVSGPSWIRTDIDLAAGKCTVNVNNNASAQPRVGRLEFTAGTAAKVYVAVTQDAPAENEDVLEVEPKEAIYFNASGNLDAEISVETNVAAGWNADAPEWVVLTKGEGKLTVNVTDNDTDGTRSCRIAITAGEATPVYVMVVQRNTIEESDSVIGQIKGEDGATDLTLTASDSSDRKSVV